MESLIKHFGAALYGTAIGALLHYLIAGIGSSVWVGMFIGMFVTVTLSIVGAIIGARNVDS